jgi:hypothetical protein
MGNCQGSHILVNNCRHGASDASAYLQNNHIHAGEVPDPVIQ